MSAVVAPAPLSSTDIGAVRRLEDAVATVIRGKPEAIRAAVVALLSRGHLLIEDIPGVGKTTLARTLAAALGGTFRRIQFTSDLLPSDIVGVSVYDQHGKIFELKRGPIFANVVLADEINRTTPRTQSALLEAMSEGQVSIDDATHELPRPFMVIATQNPAEHYGTYPLPESQMDRFIIRTGIGYPPEDIERSIIKYGSIRDDIRQITPIVSVNDILDARRSIREHVYISDKVTEYVFAIISATRNHPLILSGISTRGGINIVEAARVYAYLEGRDYVAPDDVKGVAVPVGAHRLVCRPEHEGLDKEELLKTILGTITVPLA